jgi:hypothetical protein
LAYSTSASPAKQFTVVLKHGVFGEIIPIARFRRSWTTDIPNGALCQMFRSPFAKSWVSRWRLLSYMVHAPTTVSWGRRANFRRLSDGL